VARVMPGRGASAPHLEGDEDGLEKTVRGELAKATPLLVDQDLTMTMIETPRVWEVLCQIDLLRSPP
jgi:hypothetical protein